MRFSHRFRVQAPLDEVVTFHRRSASMAAITPPPILVRVHQAPAMLKAGDQMDFTMWLGPLPIRWVAQIDDHPDTGFVDRQVRGPFAQWDHRHTFVALAAQETEVIDEVTVQLHEDSVWWQLVGFGMWLGLPLLFAYRAWRTRQLLEDQMAK